MRAILRKLSILAVATLGLLVAGCEETVEPIKVGSKDFTENMILAEMMAALIEEERIPVQRSIPYGDAFVTFEGLKRGRIDLYPEYNGTGLIFLGQPPIADGDAATERVRSLFSGLSLTWRDRFGLSNDYVLTMRAERAQALGIRRISDLARLPEVRFAVDEDFTKRPLDGLGALIRRYGLRQGATVAHKLSNTATKDLIVQALLQDDADVAELFRTDPQIGEYELVILEDDLRFFPVYQAAPLVRDQALQRFPAITAALAKLDGKVSSEAMRALNAEVDLNGQTPRAAAIGFLIDQGLLRQANVAAVEGEVLPVAMDANDSLSGAAGKALRAVRTVFPTRTVQVRPTPQPTVEVAAGRARLGVASADAFFAIQGDRAVPLSGTEALAAVGYKLAHIITRADGPTRLEDVRRLGVGQANSTSDRTARMVLGALDLGQSVSVVTSDSEDLNLAAEALNRGEVDGLFVMAPDGDTSILTLMQRGGLKLLPLTAWTSGNAALRFSFLRPAQIRAGSYPGQDAAIETVSAQMVLVGPPSEREEIGAQGPVTTGTAATQPLSPTDIRELNRVGGTGELVDPALPIPPALSPELAAPPQRLEADFWGAAINLSVVVLLGFLFYLLIAEPSRTRREPKPGP